MPEKFLLLTNSVTGKKQAVLFGGFTGANEVSTTQNEKGDWVNIVVYPNGKFLAVNETPVDIYGRLDRSVGMR